LGTGLEGPVITGIAQEHGTGGDAGGQVPLQFGVQVRVHVEQQRLAARSQAGQFIMFQLLHEVADLFMQPMGSRASQ